MLYGFYKTTNIMAMKTLINCMALAAGCMAATAASAPDPTTPEPKAVEMPAFEEIVQPSPKAAFLKYGEYPVSLYTGLVDITIPIYTIKTGWTEVPIEFKYHASGLKYDDVSME